MAKIYILLCSSCDWKIVSDLSDTTLHELKNDTMGGRKFRCPRCGKAVSPRLAPDPQSDLDRKKEEDRLRHQNKKWMEENIQFQKNFNEEKANGE